MIESTGHLHFAFSFDNGVTMDATDFALATSDRHGGLSLRRMGCGDESPTTARRPLASHQFV